MRARRPRWKWICASAGLILLLAFSPFAVRAIASTIDDQFQTWLKTDLWPKARAQGISAGTFNAAFAGVSPNLKLPDLVIPGRKPTTGGKQHQAEFRSPGAYFDHIEGVVAGGRARAGALRQPLAAMEKRFGVPPGILLAIWGRESGFGTARIPYNAFEVLGTKAFMARRKDLFLTEVLAALEMVQRGHIAPGRVKSSWAGALGEPQFLPSSYLKYAVDFDRDGVADIWNSDADSLASIANYLAGHGWVRGRDWGFEVTVPDSVSCALEGPDHGRPIAAWTRLGIRRVAGKAFPSSELREEGYLMMPAGRFGPAFIVTPNFYVLKDYNESDLYALFVGHAGDRIMYGDIDFEAGWRNVGSLRRSDIAATQRALIRDGYDVGGADGLPGFKTRRSIGDWQSRHGLSPTCFPVADAMRAIR